MKLINKIKQNLENTFYIVGIALFNVSLAAILKFNYLLILGVELIGIAILIELYKMRKQQEKKRKGEEIINISIPHWKRPIEEIEKE